MPAGFSHRAWLAPAEAAGTMLVLARELAWSQPEVRVYGRVTRVPRQICAMGAAYGYSGLAHAEAPWHPLVAAMRDRLVAELGCRFNSCLLNRYRDGADAIGWHADDEPELGPEPTIASVSLGSPRTFAARHRATRERHDWLLGDGDLLVMWGRAQLDYEHSVPRRARAGERVNLTFRAVTSALQDPGVNAR